MYANKCNFLMSSGCCSARWVMFFPQNKSNSSFRFYDWKSCKVREKSGEILLKRPTSTWSLTVYSSRFPLTNFSICDWSLTWDIWIKTGSTSYMYRWQEDEANKWFLICVCIVRNLSLLKSDTLLENFFGWINAVFLWKIQEKLVDFFSLEWAKQYFEP